VTDYGHNAVKKIQPTGGYYINPALPLGLSFNNTTGTISGTPIAASPATNYTVTAWNQYGSSSKTLNITVNAVTMNYASPQTFIAGIAITPLSPTGGHAAAPGYSTSTTTLGSGFNIPAGVAVDAQGNVFIGDQNNNVVKEIPGGTGTPITIATGFSVPDGIAIDGQGNIFVADDGNNLVKEVPFAGGIYGAPVVLASGFSFLQPFDVAVDSKGNVYVADRGHNAVEEIPKGSSTAVAIGSGFTTPTGVAVDAYGNVYVADNGNSAIKEIPAGNGTPITLGSGFSNPFAVAVDGSGNVFVTDYGHKLLKEIPINGGSIMTIGSGYSFIYGVATDNANNVYVTDYGNNAVKKIQPTGGYYINPALPLGLSFNNTTGTISGTPAAASPATNYQVIAYNGYGGNKATVNINVAANANLSNLTLSNGTLNPAFAFGTTSYTANVVNTVASMTITPTSADPNATIVVNGTTVASGNASQSLPLAAGPNVITAEVIGQDGVTIKNYTVTVTRALSTNAYLSKLGPSVSGLTPTFSGNTTSYTINASNATASMTLTPVSSDANATIKVNGTAVASGTTTSSIALAEGGQTVITTVVTAQDGVTTKTYTITVTRAPSSNATLSNLQATDGSLNPVFASGTISYTDNVTNADSTIAIVPTAADANATITVNGSPVTSGMPSGPIPLAEGAQTIITTIVKSQDGTATKTYTVKVTRAPSSDASLAGIVLSKGTLSPAFASGTPSYTANVANSITSVTVTSSTTDKHATLTVNGTAVTPGTASGAIALPEGAQTFITIVVTAQDGTTKQTYSVIVTRAPSNNANLSKIGQSVGGLTPAFTPGTTSYTETVSYATSTITVTPVTSDPEAMIQEDNNEPVTSGTTSPPIALAEGGQTVIPIKVIANDGVTTKTYTLTVTRGPSPDASLANIVTSKGTLNPAFATTTTAYTTSVANSVSTITVTPTTTDANATIKVNGTAVTSGTASGAIALAEGNDTAISIVITAQNGTTKETYTITVSRGPSTNANLSTLGQSIGGLTPAFAPGTTSYTDNVLNTTASITLKPVSSDANATIKVNGTAVASGTMTSPIALAVGSNPITTVVTAQDGITTKTYTLNVIRASGGADSYNPGISVTKPTETATLAEDGIQVHQGLSPNGDGINDFLLIDNISQYPDNKLMIMNRNGQLVFETRGYDNSSKIFDGHSNKNGQLQLPGTYFYQLDYTANGVTKHKTGFIVLKY